MQGSPGVWGRREPWGHYVSVPKGETKEYGQENAASPKVPRSAANTFAHYDRHPVRLPGTVVSHSTVVFARTLMFVMSTPAAGAEPSEVTQWGNPMGFVMWSFNWLQDQTWVGPHGSGGGTAEVAVWIFQQACSKNRHTNGFLWFTQAWIQPNWRNIKRILAWILCFSPLRSWYKSSAKAAMATILPSCMVLVFAHLIWTSHL